MQGQLRSSTSSLALNQSIATTGGVYKRQGRILHALVKHTYKVFLVQEKQFKLSIPSAVRISWDSPLLSQQEPIRTALFQRTIVCRVQPRTSRSITDLLLTLHFGVLHKNIDPSLHTVLERLGSISPEGLQRRRSLVTRRWNAVTFPPQSRGRDLVRYRNQPDKSLHQPGAAMHHP